MTSDHFYSQKKYIYEYIKNARDFLLWNHEPGLNQLLWDRPCGTLETQDFPCQAPAGLVRQEAG